jgi:integrase
MRSSGGARHWLNAAIERASMPVLTPHGLRRTITVTWLKAGVAPLLVSKRLGHALVAFTLNVYASVSDDWQLEAIAQVTQFKAQ